MQALRIVGGRPLAGRIEVAGSKNAALAVLPATLLTDAPVRLIGLPQATDVATMCRLLERLGQQIGPATEGGIELVAGPLRRHRAPRRLVTRMRASFSVLGPLLARQGRAVVPLPGGCRIGARPVDVHLRGLEALGAEIQVVDQHVVARCRQLRGTRISAAAARGPSVTGTSHLLSAAVLARGETRILDAAREPEVVEFGKFLGALGGRIEGLGTDELTVRGVDQLGGGWHRLGPDRIEAATWLLAATMTCGRVTVGPVKAGELGAVLDWLIACGATIELARDAVTLTMTARPRSVDYLAGAFPALPTDVQPLATAVASIARGRAMILDRAFPERWGHLSPLKRLGASIQLAVAGCRVTGVPTLEGTAVAATDLRAGAALVLAGLAARGATTITGLDHIDRGYERLVEKLSGLGAAIERAELSGSSVTSGGATIEV